MDELQAIADRIARRDHGGVRGPWTLELYPTLACNLSCRFCDTTVRHQKPVGELSAERMIRLVEEAAALGARRLMVLGGGEPLLAPHTLPLMARAKALGLQGMLTTNGTLLGRAARQALLDMRWDELHVSLDGASPRTHDHLRGQPGAFARTVKHLCRLRAERQAAGSALRLSLHTVLTRHNVDELAAIVRLAAAVGAEAVELDALIAYRPEQLEVALGPAEEARLPRRIAEGLAEAERLGVRTTYARFAHAVAARRGVVSPAAGEGAGYAAAPCLKAWHHLTVAADGRIAACCVLAGEGESVANVPLAELWETSPWLQSLRAGMLRGEPGGRCAECSENLLSHERAIRARLVGAA